MHELRLLGQQIDECIRFFFTVPIDKWRPGYLWVSHLTSQLWCEQQMEYGFSRPQEASRDPEHVVRGSELHLARELESEEYVNVTVQSDEDIFAIKVFNLINHLNDCKEISREVPIFGWVQNIFLMGKIDEIQRKESSWKISEFKTRKKPYLPGKAQQDTHKLQVMIYQYLLSQISTLDTKRTCEKLRLDPEKKFGEDVIKFTSVETLRDLLCILQLQPTVRLSENLLIEYSCQEQDAVFAKIEVAYDEAWMLTKVEKSQQYWLGQRTAEGVDIEEAWKCSMCDFADNCEWRLSKVKEAQSGKVPKVA